VEDSELHDRHGPVPKRAEVAVVDVEVVMPLVDQATGIGEEVLLERVASRSRAGMWRDQFRESSAKTPLGPAELIGALRADRRVESTADDTSHSHTRTLATT
jgi:hypothetical protein